jgi:hypothetical protein
VLGRVPLGEVQACELKRARLSSPLTVTFRDGGRWLLEVARLDRSRGKKLADTFSARSQAGEYVPAAR